MSFIENQNKKNIENDKSNIQKKIFHNNYNFFVLPRTPPYLTNNSVCYEKYKKYKSIAYDAYRNEKIFTIHGNLPSLKQALIDRGWIEKFRDNQTGHLNLLTQFDLLNEAKDGNEYEKILISKMLNGCHVNFIWQFNNNLIYSNDNQPFCNRLIHNQFNFTRKDGLSECVEEIYWNYIENHSDIKIPRCYRMIDNDNLREFLNDYRLTCVTGFLNFLLENKENLWKYFQKNGKIPISSINYAINRLENFFDTNIEHKDIDYKLKNNRNQIQMYEWHLFYKHQYSIIHDQDVFNEIDENFLIDLIKYIEKILKKFYDYNPDRKYDGWFNYWIIKPVNLSRGKSITIMNDDTKILNHLEENNKQKFIVQKYIERPLLIHNTKFDIRQYFLITVDDGILIWMYKDCYLRFSSKEFSLENLDESIHLTNYSVQKNYKNYLKHTELSQENMWSLDQFKTYLKNNNHNINELWDRKIYSTMKKSIINLILNSFDHTEYERNLFHLYGCDFMITEDFTTYLIEVNYHPDLSYSTSITKKICSKVLQDLVKTVIDRIDDHFCETGDFELIDRLDIPKIPVYLNGLNVTGKKIKSNKTIKSPIGNDRIKKNSINSGKNENDLKCLTLPTKLNKIKNILSNNESLNSNIIGSDGEYRKNFIKENIKNVTIKGKKSKS